MANSEKGMIGYAGQQYSFFSGQASTVCRALGLSAIALAWLFADRAPDNASTTPAADTFHVIIANSELRDVLTYGVWFLIFDALQYITASFLWGLHRWSIERILTNTKFDPSLPGYSSYYVADLLGIVSYLRRSAGLGRAFKSRYRALSAKISVAQSDPQDALALAWSEPIGPGLISITTGVLFAAKIFSLAWAYLHLHSYVS